MTESVVTHQLMAHGAVMAFLVALRNLHQQPVMAVAQPSLGFLILMGFYCVKVVGDFLGKRC